jgi:hypothetical protein
MSVLEVQHLTVPLSSVTFMLIVKCNNLCILLNFGSVVAFIEALTLLKMLLLDAGGFSMHFLNLLPELSVLTA